MWIADFLTRLRSKPSPVDEIAAVGSEFIQHTLLRESMWRQVLRPVPRCVNCGHEQHAHDTHTERCLFGPAVWVSDVENAE